MRELCELFCSFNAKKGRSRSDQVSWKLKVCGTHNFITSISRRFDGDPLVIAPLLLYCLFLLLSTELNPGDNPGCQPVALAEAAPNCSAVEMRAPVLLQGHVARDSHHPSYLKRVVRNYAACMQGILARFAGRS